MPCAIWRRRSIFSDSEDEEDELDFPSESEALMEIAGKAASLGVIGAGTGVKALGGCRKAPTSLPFQICSGWWRVRAVLLVVQSS